MNSDVPRMKVSEDGESVIVKVYVSGIDEKNIELEVKEDSLKIDISKEFEKKIKKPGCVGGEWKNTSFSGVVSLPCKVVPMLIHHSYDGKVLEVRLKKA